MAGPLDAQPGRRQPAAAQPGLAGAGVAMPLFGATLLVVLAIDRLATMCRTCTKAAVPVERRPR